MKAQNDSYCEVFFDINDYDAMSTVVLSVLISILSMFVLIIQLTIYVIDMRERHFF